jgi:hypothetical protein
MDDDFTYMSYCSFYSSEKPKPINEEEDETDTSDDGSADSGEE